MEIHHISHFLHTQEILTYQLEDLIDQGLLTEEECKKVKFGNRADTVDYEKLYNGRFKLLKKAYKKSNIGEKEEFKKFKDETAIG